MTVKGIKSVYNKKILTSAEKYYIIYSYDFSLTVAQAVFAVFFLRRVGNFSRTGRVREADSLRTSVRLGSLI